MVTPHAVLAWGTTYLDRVGLNVLGLWLQFMRLASDVLGLEVWGLMGDDTHCRSLDGGDSLIHLKIGSILVRAYVLEEVIELGEARGLIRQLSFCQVFFGIWQASCTGWLMETTWLMLCFGWTKVFEPAQYFRCLGLPLSVLPVTEANILFYSSCVVLRRCYAMVDASADSWWSCFWKFPCAPVLPFCKCKFLL